MTRVGHQPDQTRGNDGLDAAVASVDVWAVVATRVPPCRVVVTALVPCWWL